MGLFNSGIPEGRGLIREGGSFKKLDEKDIYGVFYLIFVDSTYNFTSPIHEFDTVLSKTKSKLTCNILKLNKLKVFGNFRNLIYEGGLNGEGGLHVFYEKLGSGHSTKSFLI